MTRYDPMSHLAVVTLKSTPGYPAKGEIDLMKYYDDKGSDEKFTAIAANSTASDKDVKCLLWMSTLSFN